MHFYPNERLALFIDGANLYATAKALGFDIDYKRLLALFREQGSAGARALLHGAGRGPGILVDPAAGRLARLQRLHHGDQADQGVHRRARPPQDQGQHGHRAHRRCHAPGRASRPRRAVLRRRRLPRLVEAVQQRGLRVSVVSTLQTQPPMVADELRRQADQFVDLADLEEQICRDPATRPVREPGAPPDARPRQRPRRRRSTTPTRKTTPLTARRPSSRRSRMTGQCAGAGRGRRATARSARGSWRSATANRRAEPDWHNGAGRVVRRPTTRAC